LNYRICFSHACHSLSKYVPTNLKLSDLSNLLCLYCISMLNNIYYICFWTFTIHIKSFHNNQAWRNRTDCFTLRNETNLSCEILLYVCTNILNNHIYFVTFTNHKHAWRKRTNCSTVHVLILTLNHTVKETAL
jgi:hypothetical protein